jgi:hypothetical protein
VNDKNLLVPGSFIQAQDGESVEAGTTSFPILGKGKRVITNTLNTKQGKNRGTLTLENVAVVEGFHVNIVSEARLREKGLWYCGMDCTLRWGTIEQSRVLKELTRAHNLVFLEYNPPSTPCSSGSLVIGNAMLSQVIPSSSAGVIAALKERLRERRWRPSQDPPKPKTDTKELWHAKSGHLGARALQALVYKARNIRIQGTRHIKCKSCAKTYAIKQISKRPPKKRSPKPFWRIH